LAGPGCRHDVRRACPGIIADDELGFRAQQLTDPRPGLVFGQHNVSLAEEVGTAQRQQALVTGPRPDEGYPAGGGGLDRLAGR
jgi:hypothetical protein